MAEPVVTNELMYELLKQMHNDMSDLKIDISGVKTEIVEISQSIAAMQSDVQQICFSMDRVENRLNLIEGKLAI